MGMCRVCVHLQSGREGSNHEKPCTDGLSRSARWWAIAWEDSLGRGKGERGDAWRPGGGDAQTPDSHGQPLPCCVSGWARANGIACPGKSTPTPRKPWGSGWTRLRHRGVTVGHTGHAGKPLGTEGGGQGRGGE